MRNSRAAKSYGGTRLETATSLDVTCLLHQRAILELAREAKARERGDEIARRSAVAHARRIAFELVSGIDLGQGELAASLHRLYAFAATRLSPLAPPSDLRIAAEIFTELGGAYGELLERGRPPSAKSIA
ncbi:MAG: flagellar protein FliS [Planctomycetes bacterium]|nr:flagellar protein FliS [Planctomycetota bacterium]